MESFGEKPTQQTQPKRQMEEKESLVLATKKRHIDSITSINTIVSNSTNSSGFDDANSSNSLSPISQELQTITSHVESTGPSDIRIHDLESEALMDYFNSNSINTTNANKEQWEASNGGNQTAQLSQLRKLLGKPFA